MILGKHIPLKFWTRIIYPNHLKVHVSAALWGSLGLTIEINLEATSIGGAI